MRSPHHLLSGWLAAFGVLLIWSGWVVVARLGVMQTLTIYDMVALRFLVAVIAVSPFIVSYWPRNLCWWKVALLGCGPGVPYLLLAFTGMKFAPASHAGNRDSNPLWHANKSITYGTKEKKYGKKYGNYPYNVPRLRGVLWRALTPLCVPWRAS